MVELALDDPRPLLDVAILLRAQQPPQRELKDDDRGYRHKNQKQLERQKGRRDSSRDGCADGTERPARVHTTDDVDADLLLQQHRMRVHAHTQ